MNPNCSFSSFPSVSLRASGSGFSSCSSAEYVAWGVSEV